MPVTSFGGGGVRVFRGSSGVSGKVENSPFNH